MKRSISCEIEAGGVTLPGMLEIPPKPIGLVVFAHGSGSSRFSPRNVLVSQELQRASIATLLLDLLTQAEDISFERRFDIELLASRVASAVRWARGEPLTQQLRVGLFGASTGAAAALRAAASDPQIACVVSRGGRPDLAGTLYLSRVRAPTMLIVGGRDAEVIELNRMAFEELSCERSMQIVAGATHLFEEPGALERVAAISRDWFAKHFETQRAEA